MNHEHKIKGVKEHTISASRRDFIAKYGRYTAPTVVALLVPGQSYSHDSRNFPVVYSTTASCGADSSGNGIDMTMHFATAMHCQGAPGNAMSEHTVINPDFP